MQVYTERKFFSQKYRKRKITFISRQVMPPSRAFKASVTNVLILLRKVRLLAHIILSKPGLSPNLL